MEPLSLAAAIALARTAISTAKEVTEIGSAINALFHHQEQDKKKKPKPEKAAPKSRLQQIIRQRSGESTDSYEDPLSLSSIATARLQKIKQQTEIDALGREVNRKGGAGIWESIEAEQVTRIKEHKAAIKKRKIAAKIKAEEDRARYKKYAIEAAKATFLIAFASSIGWFLYWAANTPKGG